MAQHCINNQDLLAEEIWPMFSPRKTDVYKMPSVSLKIPYYMIETDYIVIVYLLAYQSIFFFLFVSICFSVTICDNVEPS